MAPNEAGIHADRRKKVKVRESDIPAGFTKPFAKNRKTSDFFETLRTAQKREYLAWISEAKREETLT